jgi:ubiquinone/menaquinone biosynthesis C-methylase UbiE
MLRIALRVALAGVMAIASIVRPAAQAKPEQIFEAAGLKAGQTACEIGAGPGDLSFAAARLVGAEGRVFANELEWRLPALRVRTADRNLTNLTVVTAEPTKTGFADATCDAIFMKDVYHHFVEPAAMNRAMARALKPGGRLVIVDFTPPGQEATTPADRGAEGSFAKSRKPASRSFPAAPLRAAGTCWCSGRLAHRAEPASVR